MEIIDEIINRLKYQGIIKEENIEYKQIKSGTTNGTIYLLSNGEKPLYVLKKDRPEIITTTKDFLNAYRNVQLLPNVYYTDENNEFIVYSYIFGDTHINRGSKLDWMTIIVEELFNQYKKADEKVSRGRVMGINRNSWADFNLESLEYAKANIGDSFSSEEHSRVEVLVNKLNTYEYQEEKYYLHGDAGVHNFVFNDNKLNGIIDPSPLIGPKIYDFTYAFCSSPDDFDLETLFSSFKVLNQDSSIDNSMLLEEVLFQLYTRIGICKKVHPHDLGAYLEAWKEWREYLPSN
ncbi:hypothetical protein KD050_04265 [Psychrobacillus sp. INOP01]|uniref:hypothetical protein n=1 Tax=Psychrobacillus sp. INOP01 TaxID=2829187 RepID=UPI001BAB4359|nr:hypothetical protein [Psychrobacillus sp. INOP01]QUG42494.1 hypothetical protein KD050_04265 [Psychrobacillus sp. INOP01]